MSTSLKTEQNTPATEKMVIKYAHKELGRGLSAFYEHGQWWVEKRSTGAQYSVVDIANERGSFVKFGFEQVTQGEE
jgi:hypothetical protein